MKYMEMIITGIVFIIIGIAALYYNQSIYNFTGPIEFIESKMPGNTVGFIKLLAVMLVLIGIFMATGIFSFITKPIWDAINNSFGGFK